MATISMLRRDRVTNLMVTVAAVLLSAATAAGTNPASPTSEWQVSIASVPTPGTGCFTSHYPSRVWTQVACTNGSHVPQSPARGRRAPTVGNGNDYVTDYTKAGSTIISARGHFFRVTGLKSEQSNGVPNQYTLQLNAQTFPSPTCQGSGNDNCAGWQQFIYEQQGEGGNAYAYMQYWLLNYGRPCPGGWMEADPSDCFVNSLETEVPLQPLSELKNLQLTGTVGNTDTVVITTRDSAYSASNFDGILDLKDYWQLAEFNVFGDGNRSAAHFNAGTTMDVSTITKTTFPTVPDCTNTGFTGETNNLNLGPASTCETKRVRQGERHGRVKFPQSN